MGASDNPTEDQLFRAVTTFWGYLFQDREWRSGDGRVNRLKDLDPRHRRNLIAWLERRAARLKMAYEFSLATGPQPSGEMACDAFESEQAVLWETGDQEWLNSTPLMIRLRKIEAKYNSPKQVRKRQLARLAEHDREQNQQNGWER